MKLLIYGAGVYGKRALDYFGKWRVKAFVETSPHSESVEGIMVLSFEESLKLSQEDYVYVVAVSEKYESEIIDNIVSKNVMRYFKYDEKMLQAFDAQRLGYILYGKYINLTVTEALAGHKIGNYSKIAIYGHSFFTPYYICEIAFQTGSLDTVVAVIEYEGREKIERMDYPSLGVDIKTLDEVWDEIDCLVMTVARQGTEKYDLLDRKPKRFEVIDLYENDINMPYFQHPELERYRDIHMGEKCFIIGNGPSLNENDLESIYKKGIVSFGVNSVYKIFNKTSWRPTYYVISDLIFYEEHKLGDFSYVPSEKIVVDGYNYVGGKRKDDNHFFHLSYSYSGDNLPKFSEDIVNGLFWGKTVLYDCLQIACYMGFKKIYMLGVDHSLKGFAKKEDHFLPNYLDIADRENKSNIEPLPYDRDAATRAFQAAKEYADRNGIEIYNCTRGGELEVFDRLNFDDLIKGCID